MLTLRSVDDENVSTIFLVVWSRHIFPALYSVRPAKEVAARMTGFSQAAEDPKVFRVVARSLIVITDLSSPWDSSAVPSCGQGHWKRAS